MAVKKNFSEHQNWSIKLNVKMQTNQLKRFLWASVVLLACKTEKRPKWTTKARDTSRSMWSSLWDAPEIRKTFYSRFVSLYCSVLSLQIKYLYSQSDFTNYINSNQNFFFRIFRFKIFYFLIFIIFLRFCIFKPGNKILIRLIKFLSIK